MGSTVRFCGVLWGVVGYKYLFDTLGLPMFLVILESCQLSVFLG